MELDNKTIKNLLAVKRDEFTDESILESIKNLSKCDYNKFIEGCVDFHKLLRYDEDSPSCLVWNSKSVYKSKYNKCVLNIQKYGNIGKERYVVNLLSTTLKAHRVVYILNNGVLNSENVVDHIDGNPLNNIISNLRSVSKAVNNRNVSLRKNSNTGITGVSYTKDSKGFEYYIATWVDINGVNKFKWFSINKYGRDNSLLLAIKARSDAISFLRENGVEYGEKHGK